MTDPTRDSTSDGDAPASPGGSPIAHFARYAAAFEKAYESDDWSLVEPFFVPDASYEVGAPTFGGRFEGRAAILRYFGDVTARFDRRFESREIALLEGPRVDGDTVWIRGSATYRAAGVPDLEFELEELASFDGERIRHLEDRYAPETIARVDAYLAEHGTRLGIEAAS